MMETYSCNVKSLFAGYDSPITKQQVVSMYRSISSGFALQSLGLTNLPYAFNSNGESLSALDLQKHHKLTYLEMREFSDVKSYVTNVC